MPELELEYRSVATALEVRHPDRVIELIAAPYEEEARVFLPRLQRWVVETFARGAFAGVGGRVTVNKAHDVEAPLGYARAFHPNDPRGLVAELRIASTSAGNDALELAAEGLLGASVGFGVLPGGEEYTEGRSRRRITKAKVAHIALTGDPAYTGAQVLAVRSHAGNIAEGVLLDAGVRVPTPNLDRILLELRLERGKA
jgi:HK97 family phage prohead protease